ASPRYAPARSATSKRTARKVSICCGVRPVAAQRLMAASAAAASCCCVSAASARGKAGAASAVAFAPKTVGAAGDVHLLMPGTGASMLAIETSPKLKTLVEPSSAEETPPGAKSSGVEQPAPLTIVPPVDTVTSTGAAPPLRL